MKKLLSLVLVLILSLSALPALAEALATLDEAAEALNGASSLNEQLAILSDAALRFADELETSNWNKLNAPLPQALPEGFLPESYDAALVVEDLPEELRGKRLLALYEYDGEMRVLGEFAAWMPEEMRARSVEEAEGVLLVRRWYERRSDYIGEAYNTIDDVYTWAVGGETLWQLFHSFSRPPHSGMGRLTGEGVSLDLLYNMLNIAGNTIELTHASGTFLFRPTQSGCSLVKAVGEGERMEVPAEAGGLPVTAIENCGLAQGWPTLQAAVLPDSIVRIGNNAFRDCENLAEVNLPDSLESIGDSAFSGCSSLEELTFPASLRTIGNYAFFSCRSLVSLHLNEGLERVGRSLTANCYAIAFVTIPSTLTVLPDGFLSGGVVVTSVVVPEGVRELDLSALDGDDILCVYLPASVEMIQTYALNQNIVLYAPEDSYAASWAQKNEREYVPCESPEDMPIPVLGEENGFAYAVVGDEAVLTEYKGDAADVVVPATLGGKPVTRLGHLCIWLKDFITSITLPQSVRHICFSAISLGESFASITIPAMDATIMQSAIIFQNPAFTIIAPEGSAGQRYAEKWGCAWEAWEGAAE